MNVTLIRFFLLACVLFGTQLHSSQAFAQNMDAETMMPPETEEGIPELNSDDSVGEEEAAEASLEENQEEEIFNYKDYPSVLFTYWELSAIDKAKRSEGFTRAPVSGDFKPARKSDEEKVKPPPEERYIRLGGISYKSDDKWTVWLNEQRITPEAVPPEILDIKVYSDYVELKWFDDYTNKIFPIRLRARQRFNIDTLTFLPG